MVVGVSACLDQDCMRMSQQVQVQNMKEKRAGIAGNIKLEKLVESVVIAYSQHNRCKPVRVLVFRDGGSDGDFENILESEIPQIRQAFHNLARFESDCQGPTCQCCPPSITFVVAQNDHSVKIVPSSKSPKPSGFRNNVWSGTLVDELITPFRKELALGDSANSVSNQERSDGQSCRRFFENNASEGDFFLTAQVGPFWL